MKTIPLIWILCQCAIIVKSRYLIFSSTQETWFSANQKCKTDYNGYLADIDEIKEGSNNRMFTRCLNGSHELWTEEVYYTTDYISYKGCYNDRGSTQQDSLQTEKMTLVRCQLICRYDKGFAMKENHCKCISSLYSLMLYKPPELADCRFNCSGQTCGFYGGNHTVSIYVPYNSGQLLKTKNPTADDLCVVRKCEKPMIGGFELPYVKSRCEQQSKTFAYCDNGAKNIVGSWKDAVGFCLNKGSYLTTFPNDMCLFGFRVWQKERKYQDIVRLKGIDIKEDSTFSCISFNSSNVNGREDTGYDCHQKKPYVCVSDSNKAAAGICLISLSEISSTKEILTNFVASSAPSHISTTGKEVTANNGAHVNITSSTSLDKHVTGNNGLTSGPAAHFVPTQDSSTMTRGYSIVTNRSVQSESKTSSNNTPTIVGVSVGLTCVIAVGVLLIFIYWKRNGFGFCKPNKKTPKDNSLDKLSISGNYARANAFGKTVEIDQNSNVDNDCSSGAGPAIYALPMRKQPTPGPDTVCVDKETLDMAGSFHYDIAQPTSHYDVNESYRESSTDDYYVTKAESDYDRLHQRRDKLRHQNVEDDYSHCLPGDDEYSYSRARDEGTRTNLDEDEYSHLASIKEEGFYDGCQR